MEERKSVTPSVRLTRIYKTCHWRFCLPSQQVVLPHTSWNKSVWLGCKSPASRSVTQCTRSSGMAVGGWWIGSVRGSSRTWHICNLCTTIKMFKFANGTKITYHIWHFYITRGCALASPIQYRRRVSRRSVSEWEDWWMDRQAAGMEDGMSKVNFHVLSKNTVRVYYHNFMDK